MVYIVQGVMAGQIDIPGKLREQMERLESEIQSLQELLSQAPIRQVRVFQLPRTKSGEEHEPYEKLTSEPFESDPGLAMGVRAFSEFYGRFGESTKAVFRLPGVIALEADPGEAIAACVESINQLKQEFAQTVQLIEDRNARFEIVHRLFPMLITLQATRQIQYYNEEMRSVTFTWGRKSSIRVVTREELLENLRNLQHQKPIAFEPERWEEAINEDMIKLLALPKDTELRYRRDLKVRPMANLLLADGTKKLREANLPIIIANPAENFRIGILPNFDASVKPKRGRKNPQRLTEEERFLTCLPVYRAKEA